ncbi:MAG: hypothetical protein LBN24_08695 [Mediterranea sp.]|jgi:hypothetical protein|nr:hypothetical protein [Mediterranea sp.]
MKRSYKALALLMAGAAVAACTNDEKNVSIPATSGDEASVTFQLANAPRSTRATDQGTAAERTLSNLQVFVFNGDGSRDTKSPFVNIPTISSSNSYTLPVNVGNGKRVLVVANTSLDSIKNSATDGDYANLEKVEKTLAQTVMDKSNSLVVPTKGFAMSGLSDTWSVSEGRSVNVPISIARFVSKVLAPQVVTGTTAVDFSSLPQDSIDAMFGAGSGLTPTDKYTFTLSGYAVINGLQKSDVYDDATMSTYVQASYFNDAVTPAIDLYDKATFDAQGNFTSNYSGANGASWFQTNAPVYVYENKPVRKLVNGTEQSVASTVYAYIIQGRVHGTNVAGTINSDSSPRYWRANFIAGDGTTVPYFSVPRNQIFTMTVGTITTAGYGTPQGAAEGPGPYVPDPKNANVDFIISVTGWNVLSETTQM